MANNPLFALMLGLCLAETKRVYKGKPKEARPRRKKKRRRKKWKRKNKEEEKKKRGERKDERKRKKSFDLVWFSSLFILFFC